MSGLRTPDADNVLIKELYALNKKSPKLVKPSVQHPKSDPEQAITTWKMSEFRYYDIPSPFPTLARGLFTRKDGECYEIVARGYDKFFNIGEVPWNTWAALERHTSPPYTLTLKSNGCIIFIAALNETKLMVTSKHSLESQHAKVGEQWLHKIVEGKGRKLEEFAAALWKERWTAVAELCDDSFEEHVLPYTPENTGLHLHGLNSCSKDFHTQPPDVVDAFAREWGFIVTKSFVLDSIPAVREFTDEVGKEGEWNGEPLEGFVVRTHVSEPPTKGSVRAEQSPYAPGTDYFFKVKFDEPYMMYRDWREVTKALLSQNGTPNPGSLNKKKMQRPETKVYVKWIVEEIKRDRRQFEGYMNNHGIIATRERFLEWLASREGEKSLKETSEIPEGGGLNERSKKEFGKTIIVPIAIPGVGKTAISVALAHLFGFGHTQSDDVTTKKSGPTFVKNVVGLLKKHDVVIADKNNHLRQHRTALRDATDRMDPPVRLLALHWSFSQPFATIHRICGDRIVGRGENHQSLRPDKTLAKSHEDVVWQFIHNSEELADDEVDELIEMDLEHTPEQALRRAIDGCVKVLGVPRPSEEKIREALAVAAEYKPKVRRADGNKDKVQKPRYYGLLPEISIRELLDNQLAHDGAPAHARKFYEQLQRDLRVTKRPHVTIVHSNNIEKERALWDECEALQNLTEPPLFSFRFGHLLWNDRVMTLTVDNLAISADTPDEGGHGTALLLKIPEQVRERLHVTVGTRHESVPAVEAKALVEDWRQQRLHGIEVFPLEGEVFVQGRLKGLFN